MFVKFVSGDPLALEDWSQAKSVVDCELGTESDWVGNNDAGPVLRLRQNAAVREYDRFTFETFFGMTALTLKGRRAFFVPISERFSNELLPRPMRPSLFLEHDTSFRLERVYFRNPGFTGDLRPGDVLFFYVSKPISAVIGVARCTASEVLAHEEAAERFRRLAVLNPQEVGPKVHCVSFDNYIHFRRRISGQWLVRNHARPGNRFVTLARVPDTSSCFELVLEGLRSER